MPTSGKPNLAVLPFVNLSSDPSRDYFADGIVEDLITALSRFKSFSVVSRYSSFAYKGRAVDVRQVARELGVRYLLEGSVRLSGERVRVTVQLVDAATGTHLWASSFDGQLGQIFEFQDRITESVVGLVEPQIRRAEIERTRRRWPENPQAYDHFLRALPYFNSRHPRRLHHRPRSPGPGDRAATGLRRRAGLRLMVLCAARHGIAEPAQRSPTPNAASPSRDRRCGTATTTRWCW